MEGSVCNQKHDIKVPVRSVPHPAVSMSKNRAYAWAHHATDDDFYQFVDALARIYAKRHYNEKGGPLEENKLFVDYKKFRENAKMEVLDSIRGKATSA